MSFADSWYRASCALLLLTLYFSMFSFYSPPFHSFSLSLSLSLCGCKTRVIWCPLPSILFLINLIFHTKSFHSSYKIHQLFTDYLLRLLSSELLEKHLFRSRANRRLVLSARPKALPGTSSSKYITSLHGLLVEEGHAWCLLAKSFWKLFPLENNADRYVSKLVKTKVDGLPSTCCRGASWIKGPKAPPWHVFKSSLLASLWCLAELTSGRPLDLASWTIACRAVWLWCGRDALNCWSLASFCGLLESDAMAWTFNWWKLLLWL